jgi:large subunit ribosomal protein L4
MKVSVMNDAGSKAGSDIEVSDATFAADFNESLVHQIVVAFQANARMGTRAQKNRSAVRGGGAKPYRQKGSGQARAGTIRSPLWRGGGKVFPSSPLENFTHKVNKKMHRAGMRSILSELLRQERIVAVDSFTLESPKTKALVAKLSALGAPDVLIITDNADMNLQLSARNLHRVDVRDVSTIDPVCLIGHEKVIMTVPAIKRLQEMLA